MAPVGTYNGPGFMGGGGLSAGMNATTGLDTDADGHVLDSDFKPIKGLYAAVIMPADASSPCIRVPSPA